MTSRFRLRIIAPASLALALSQASTGPDVSARAVVEAATVYVKSYQDQLTSVLADEVYRQEIVSRVPHDPNMPRTRTLRSEVFFMFAPAGDDWMAIRDLIQVDGKTVGSRVYAPDERLGIWVPTRFRERYQHGTPAGSPDSESEYEDILCEATYSNYRRFETRVRIK